MILWHISNTIHGLSINIPSNVFANYTLFGLSLVSFVILTPTLSLINSEDIQCFSYFKNAE